MRDRTQRKEDYMSNIKGRNWAFVGYPESMPDNWFELLQNTGLPICVSPLHDKDINPDGTPKKPHFHFVCYYDNTTTFNNVKTNVCDLINATIPIKLESMVGMYRYHLHLDNPEKYQYDDRFRTFINGFDVSKVTALTVTEIKKLVLDIQDFIQTNEIVEYSDLMDLLKENNLFNMWEVAYSHTMFFNSYISSRRNKLKNS